MSDPLKIEEFLPGQSFFPPEGDEEPIVARTNISSDMQSFTLDLTEFAIAEAGPGIPSEFGILGYHFGVVLQRGDFLESSRLALELQGFASLDQDVTATVTVLIGERIYKREFRGIADEDFRWRITYPADSVLTKLRLPIVLMLSVSNQERIRGSGLVGCDFVDGLLEAPPTEDEVKETSERLQRCKEEHRKRRATKSDLT